MEQKRNYGAMTVFFGFVMLLCAGLVAYNIHYISVFKEINQTYSALPINPSIGQRLAYSYVSLFARFFGKYPTTQVLSVLIPVTAAAVVLFFVFLTKHINQKKLLKSESESIPTSEEEEKNDQSAVQG